MIHNLISIRTLCSYSYALVFILYYDQSFKKAVLVNSQSGEVQAVQSLNQQRKKDLVEYQADTQALKVSALRLY